VIKTFNVSYTVERALVKTCEVFLTTASSPVRTTVSIRYRRSKRPREGNPWSAREKQSYKIRP